LNYRTQHKFKSVLRCLPANLSHHESIVEKKLDEHLANKDSKTLVAQDANVAFNPNTKTLAWSRGVVQLSRLVDVSVQTREAGGVA
jgi:hypothetical protein